MRTLIFANNANTTLAGSISNTALTANLAAGGGALFPNPAAGQYFVGTFTDAATGLLKEIVHVTARVGDTITMVRAQEGTTALNWSANDLFAELWTAGQCQSLLQVTDSQGQSGNYGDDSGVVNAYVVVLDPVVTANAEGFPIRVKIANTNTGPSTLNYGGGVQPIINQSGTALSSGQLVANGVYEFVDDGAGNAQLQGSTAGSSTTATPITGQCRLIYNAGNLVLIPYNGNQIVVAGGTYAVPNAGVTLAPTSLTPGTSYYIYAFLSSGMLALEASATGHTASTTAGNIGTEIKSGDNTRSLVGFWQCVAGPGWSTIATQGLNWFNQEPIAVSVPFTSGASTSSATPTFAELSSSFRNTFLTWASQVVNIDFVGVVSMNAGDSGAITSIGIDNATPQDSLGGDFNSAAAASNSASYGKLRLTLTEGLHYATALGAVSSGSTGTWNGGATPGVRCVLSVEVRG